MNYVTADMARRLVARETTLASNLRFVMWPVEQPDEDMTQIWQRFNQYDFVVIVDNIREEEHEYIPGIPSTRVVADFDGGIYGTHKVRLIVGSYVTTVPYYGETYAETREYGDFFHR